MPSTLYTQLYNSIPGDSRARWQAILSIAPLLPFILLLIFIIYLTTLLSASRKSQYPQLVFQNGDDQISSRVSAYKHALKDARRKMARLRDDLSASRQFAVNAAGSTAAAMANIKCLSSVLTRYALRVDRLELMFSTLFRALGVQSIGEIIQMDANQTADLQHLDKENTALKALLQASESRCSEQQTRMQQTLAGHFKLAVDRCQIQSKLDAKTELAKDLDSFIDEQADLIRDYSTKMRDSELESDGVISAQTAEIADLRAQLAAATSARDQFEQDANANMRRASDFAEVARSATGELKKQGDLLSQLKVLHATELAHTRATVQRKDNIIAALLSQIDDLEASQESLEQHSSSLTQLGSTQADQLTEALASSGEKDDVITYLRCRVNSLELSLVELGAQNSSLSLLKDDLGEQLSRASEDVECKDKTIAALRERIGCLAREQEALTEELDTLRELREAHSDQLALAQDDLELKDETIAMLRGQVEHLESTRAPIGLGLSSLPTPSVSPSVLSSDLTSSTPFLSPLPTEDLVCAPCLAEDSLATPPLTPPSAGTELCAADPLNDDSESFITPLPRRLPRLRDTKYSPRPMILAGMLIRQAYIHCSAHVEPLPLDECYAVVDLEDMAWTPPPPVKWRPYPLRWDSPKSLQGAVIQSITSH